MTSAGALREPLERLYREFDYGARLARDAIEFPLRYAAPDDRMIIGWLPGRFEVLLSGFAEDAGDGADVVAASIGGGEARPLIQGVQGVRTLVTAPDGRWLLGLLDDDPSAVHLFPTGDGQAARVEMLPPVQSADADDELPLMIADVACAGAMSQPEERRWQPWQ